jgi:hypothetical protein
LKKKDQENEIALKKLQEETRESLKKKD